MSRRNELKLKVQVWIYRVRSGALEVLLLKLNPERGSYWQPVTGGVDAGEKLPVAALREAREETGLPFTQAPEPLNYHFRYRSERLSREFEEHVFGLQAPRESAVPGSIRLDPREHVEARWVAADVAEAELRHPSNAEGLRRLRASRETSR